MPPIAPGAEQWWAGSVESRRAKDAARDSLLLAGGALDGTDALAERAAAWKAERAKLVEGHAALARRLASEVEARESVHTKLLSAEARAGMVDALEKSAKDANARSDALQQRIDTLVGSLETRDEEARHLRERNQRGQARVHVGLAIDRGRCRVVVIVKRWRWVVGETLEMLTSARG